MCTVESPIHKNIKEQIVKADENSTIVILSKFRNSTRVMKARISAADPKALYLLF